MSDWTKRFLGWDHFPADLDELETEAFFTLSEAELAAVRGHRRDANRLAIAIQIGYMRMTGMALNSPDMIPQSVLSHVAAQLGQVSPQLGSIRAFYARRRTLHDHQESARSILGLRTLSEHGWRKLKTHLRKIVPGQVAPRELVREARRWLDHNRCLQTAERPLMDLARDVRREFDEGLRGRLSPMLTELPASRWIAELCAEQSQGVTRLEWLRAGPHSRRSKGLADHLAKLRFLKDIGADRLDLGLTEAALRSLAMPLLQRKASSLRPGTRINPLAVACFLRLRLLELNDQGFDLLDYRIADLWRQARQRAEVRQAGMWRRLRLLPHDLAVLAGNDNLADAAFRQGVLALIDPFVEPGGSVPVSKVAVVREELAGQERALGELLAAAADLGIDASGNAALGDALATLRRTADQGELAAGTLNPFGTTWRALIDHDDRRRALGAYKAATVLLLKRALRNGQACCPAGLRHRALKDRLIPAVTWLRDRGVLVRSLALPDGPERALARLRDLLGSRLADLAAAVESGALRIDNGQLVVPRIKRDDEDPVTSAIRRRIFTQVGQAQLADVLVEADATARFSRAALGRAPRGEEELVSFYAAVLALGSDHSAADMARMVPGMTPDAIGAMIRRLEQGKGLRAANAAVLEQFRRLPVARSWGEGVTASADMMSLETSRRLWAARLDPRRRTASVGTYTHVLDQWAIAYDQPVLLNRRQAGAAIEGALGHAGIERLAVDTHGYTNFAMGLAKLTGIDLCPRLANLADRKLHVPRGFTVPTPLADVTRCTIGQGAIAKGWDGLLHLSASVKHGWCPATWALDRFGTAAKGNAVFEAGDALGALVRSIYLCDYLANAEFRRTVHALLAQGEAVHGLQRAIHAGPVGVAHGRSGEELTAISGALTLITNLVIYWNARQIDTIVAKTPDQFPQEHLAHIAPIAHAHINLRGTLHFRLRAHRNALLDRPQSRPSQAQNRSGG